MKRLINIIQRACIYYMVRSLERQLHDQINALGYVASMADFQRINDAAIVTRKELAHYRAEYSALLPIGERRTWKFS